MARVSFAHGPVAGNLERISRVRAAAAESGRIVGILGDLPGPKIRAAPFPDEGVYLLRRTRRSLSIISVTRHVLGTARPAKIQRGEDDSPSPGKPAATRRCS